MDNRWEHCMPIKKCQLLLLSLIEIMLSVFVEIFDVRYAKN